MKNKNKTSVIPGRHPFNFPNKSPRQLCLFHRCPDADDADDGGAGISFCFQRTATARVTAGSTLKATAPLDRFFSLPFPVPL